MAQEPKSKQKKLDEIYELVVLNHTFLSSLSSLSTYIQQHSTTEASEGFQSAIDGIDQNLGHVLLILQDQKVKGDFPTKENEQFFKNNIAHFFDEFYEKKEDERSLIASTERHLQEAHLVLEQLKWLFSTSRKMLVLISKVSFD